MSSSPAVASIIYLGLDVHKDSVTIAVLPADAKAPTRIDKVSERLRETAARLRAPREGRRDSRVLRSEWGGLRVAARDAGRVCPELS